MGHLGPPDGWNGLSGHDLEREQGICLEVLWQPNATDVARIVSGRYLEKTIDIHCHDVKSTRSIVYNGT